MNGDKRCPFSELVRLNAPLSGPKKCDAVTGSRPIMLRVPLFHASLDTMIHRDALIQ